MMQNEVSIRIPPDSNAKASQLHPKNIAESVQKTNKNDNGAESRVKDDKTPIVPSGSVDRNKDRKITSPTGAGLSEDNRRERKVDEWKDAGKLVWKPKTRAAGTNAIAPEPTLLGQCIVRKFGSGKRCSSLDALRRAEERASITQSEVYPSIPQPIAQPSTVVDLETFGGNSADLNGPCDETISEIRAGSAWWGKSVLPLDFSVTEFSDLEEKTRTLYQLGEQWVMRDEVNPVLVSESIDLQPRGWKLQMW